MLEDFLKLVKLDKKEGIFKALEGRIPDKDLIQIKVGTYQGVEDRLKPADFFEVVSAMRKAYDGQLYLSWSDLSFNPNIEGVNIRLWLGIPQVHDHGHADIGINRDIIVIGTQQYKLEKETRTVGGYQFIRDLKVQFDKITGLGYRIKGENTPWDEEGALVRPLYQP